MRLEWIEIKHDHAHALRYGAMTQAQTSGWADRDDTPEGDQVVWLHDATWKDYERLLALRGEGSVPRISYLEGEIEIMSPSLAHESIKSRIGRLVELYCIEREIEFSAYGSWTLKKRRDERGAEPDECYVFGDVSNPKRPDLAIEVLWTSGRLDKLEIYRKLGVREVWYWRKGRITPYRLRGERYKAIARSAVMPGLDLDRLASFIDRPTMSRSILDYRAFLRAQPGAPRT
jgi:Uma2 family endonuclease